MLYFPVKPLMQYGRICPDSLRKYYFPLYAFSSGYVLAGPGFITKRDSRFDYQFILTTGGKGILTVNGVTWQLTPGTIALIDCSRLHTYRTEGDTRWEYKYIHLAGVGMKSYADNLRSLPIVLHVSDPEPFESCIDFYLNEDPMYSMTDMARSCMKLSELLFHLIKQMEAAENPETEQNTNTSGEISAVITYIHDHFRENINLEDLARQAHLSKYHMCHKFKAATCTSPHQYILSLRLNHSQRLLYETESSISEIAIGCGFNSTGEFVRIFRKKFGKLPSECRKEGYTAYL